MFTVVGSSFHMLYAATERACLMWLGVHSMLYAAAEKACLLWLGVHSICFMQQQREHV